MQKILYLPVETVVRDLDGNLLLGYEAIKRGYDVVLGTITEVMEYAEYRGGGAYLFKHWEHYFPYPFDDEKRENFCYIGFHPEGLVYADEDFLKNLNVTGKSEKLDLKFVYGEEQKNLLIKFNPLLKDMIHAVGHPRFDLLRPSYHSFYQKEVDSLQKKYGRYLLVNTNFTIGNPAGYYKKGLIERKNEESLQKWGKPLDNDQRIFFEKAIEHFKKLLDEYIKMVQHISEKFDEYTIIVRPHPSEDHSVYQKVFKGSDRVKVIHEGNVVNWILGAESVIQTGCTTGIETWATHKPAIRYNPIEEGEKLESELPNKFGIHATTLEELENLIQKLLNGELKSSFNEQVSIAKPFIKSIEGEPSVVRMMNLIDQVMDKKEIGKDLPDRPIRKDSSIEKRIEEIRRRVLRKIRTTYWLMKWRHGEKKAVEKAAAYQKFPGITVHYMRNALKTLSHLDGHDLHKSIKIDRVDTDSFILRKIK